MKSKDILTGITVIIWLVLPILLGHLLTGNWNTGIEIGYGFFVLTWLVLNIKMFLVM